MGRPFYQSREPLHEQSANRGSGPVKKLALSTHGWADAQR
jgi:hypothetical protein